MHEADAGAEAALDALVPRLRQFVVVAREEHLTRAAELLGVPQPTLSRSIARLEAELGVPLFARPGRSIRLPRLSAPPPRLRWARPRGYRRASICEMLQARGHTVRWGDGCGSFLSDG